MEKPERITIQNAYTDLRVIRDGLGDEDSSGVKAGIKDVLTRLQLALEYDEDCLKGNYNH